MRVVQGLPKRGRPPRSKGGRQVVSVRVCPELVQEWRKRGGKHLSTSIAQTWETEIRKILTCGT